MAKERLDEQAMSDLAILKELVDGHYTPGVEPTARITLSPPLRNLCGFAVRDDDLYSVKDMVAVVYPGTDFSGNEVSDSSPSPKGKRSSPPTKPLTPVDET
jgi:hypothetical protein